MFILVACVLGFAFGWRRARVRGGNRLDQWQYGTAHAIAFGLLAFLLVIIGARVFGFGS